jgi:dTDP-4-dehydrorhamnose reductase
LKTILLTGRNGQVGHELVSALAPLGRVIAPECTQMDLGNSDSVREAIGSVQPDIIVNAAGFTTVDQAETEFGLAMQVNGVAPGIMAEEARRTGAILVHYSTDYVFDGEESRPYTETDPTNPVNAYGRSKLAGEQAIEAAGGAHLVLRTSWIYGGHRTNFVLTMLRLARERKELNVVIDQLGSPTWARSLALATADLLLQQEVIRQHSGIYHLSATGHVSRYEFATAIIRLMGETVAEPHGWATFKPIPSAQYPLPARRPVQPVTSKEKIKRVFNIEMPHWETQLRNFLHELAGNAESMRQLGLPVSPD